MTRWENCDRSGGDRTRDHLLPKQVRCLCATLRAGRQPDADGPGHDGNLFAWLPHKPSRPQSRQRPEVERGRCRSGGGEGLVEEVQGQEVDGPANLRIAAAKVEQGCVVPGPAAGKGLHLADGAKFFAQVFDTFVDGFIGDGDHGSVLF